MSNEPIVADECQEDAQCKQPNTRRRKGPRCPTCGRMYPKGESPAEKKEKLEEKMRKLQEEMEMLAAPAEEVIK